MVLSIRVTIIAAIYTNDDQLANSVNGYLFMPSIFGRYARIRTVLTELGYAHRVVEGVCSRIIDIGICRSSLPKLELYSLLALS